MIFDSSVKDLIKAAFEVEKDVFLKLSSFDTKELSFDGIKTVVFLNGAFYGNENSLFGDFRNPPSKLFGVSASDVIYADIRFSYDENFRKFLKDNSYRRFAVLFAECAAVGEYGWKSSYSMLGDLREQREDYCQIVAFLSSFSDCIDECRIAFSAENAVFAGEDIIPEFSAFKARDMSEKKYLLAQQIEKYAFKNICVYFNSRSEALEFSRYLSNRGTRAKIFDGAKSFSEMQEISRFFENGEYNILLATKSFIPSSLFFPVDKVYFCGVPFSLSHVYRCAFSLKNEPVRIIYCEDDIARNNKIIDSYAKTLGDVEISIKRRKSLLDITKLL